ncbi:MAG TPA: response regulator, partial [Sulfuricurvum sp.]|nr:response regulator [Sulfuricurvum sp.]
IKIEASFAADSITVHVIDTGIGIAAKDQKHIFDPFSQARSDEVSGRGGTGLGLSISAQLVRHMGGEITLHSQPGIGSTFSFTLPVTVGGENRPGLMDIARVQRLNLALFLPRGTTDVMADSLERYLSSFGIILQQVDSVTADFDLLFYSELQIDDAHREMLLTDPRPKIALMDAPYDTYETADNVTPLVMPLYCAKLQEVMETALGGQQQARSHTQNLPKRFNAHILVAEDNEANQELIGTLLGNLGLTYTMVDNGVQALKQMQSGEYDLVLMDEQMPKMNGNEAAKAMLEIEHDTGQEHLPVIALSANVLGSSEQRSVYDEFLGKPIRMDALVNALAEFLPYEDVSELASAHGEEAAVMIDKEELRDILQVSDAQLQQLLDVYRDKMQESLHALHEAVLEHDLKRMTLLAHSVKGSSSNFRLERMTQLAETIELAARADKAGFDYATHYAKLLENFEALNL